MFPRGVQRAVNRACAHVPKGGQRAVNRVEFVATIYGGS